MCLEEAAAAEGERRGGRGSTTQLLSKLSSGHEGGMKEESEQVDTVASSGYRSWRRTLHGVRPVYSCKARKLRTKLCMFVSLFGDNWRLLSSINQLLYVIQYKIGTALYFNASPIELSV